MSASRRKAADSAAVDSSSSKQQLHARSSGSTKLGLSSVDLRDRPLKDDGKKRLIHSDSGYISPTVAPASNGNSPQTPSKEPLKVTFQTGARTIGEEPAKTEPSEVGSVSTVQESIGEQQEILNRKADNMQRVVVEQIQKSLAAESPMEEHHYLQDDLLLLAYACRQSNMSTWASCQHPYCVFIRQMSQHFNAYRNSHNHTCEKCANWADMLTRHMNTCKDAHCPIQMCRNSRNQQLTSTMAQFQFGSGGNQSGGNPQSGGGNQSENSSHRSTPHPLQYLGRSSSFTSADADDHPSMSSLLSSRGVNPVISSLARASLRAKAEEIVNRLEREEPFSSDLSSLPASLNQQIPPVPPHSLPTHQGVSDSTHYHAQIGVQQQMMLSPIAEQPGTEDVSPGYSSIPPSLSHVGSQPQFPSLGSGFSSYELDGPGHTSIGGASVPAQSMNLGVEKSTGSEEPCVVYPKQKVLHPLNTEYLTPGQDGCYYKIRDYNLNDVDLLGVGGFGSCMCAQDITTTKMFAIKQNKNENYKSIEDECFVLSLIPHHDNVVHFLGAVIDERDLATQPPLMYKMMMELAENGDLTELLKDELGRDAPLPADQSLYYLQQILRGVNFLHQKGFLHLDIKAKNVLVFDGGRTVKLTDFGSAVQVGEAKAMHKGWTPYFVAPEVIKGEVPHFSADIWSTMCILIEMLTTKWPGCHRNVGMTDMAMMFLIGNYENDHIQNLLPLDDLDIQPEVRQLFLDVFVKEPSERPTAMHLLQRPVIRDAEEYGMYFDDYNYDSEDSEEMDSASPKATDYTSLDHGVPEASHISMASSNHSMSSMGDKVGDLPCFAESQNPKRGRGVSQDSGVGTDLEGSFNSVVYGAQLSARSLSSGSSNQTRFVYQDSGTDEMLGQECSQLERSPAASYFTSRQRSSSINRPNGYVNVNFSSLPPVPSTQTPEYAVVQRSFSFSGRTYKRSESCSRSQTRAMSGLSHVAKRQRPNSIHPKLHLTHSQSAPSIGMDPWRRRHSLQHLDSYGTGETWETDTEVDGVNPTGKPLLRRTSSEVYVDRGPDIDTPEKERNRLQELLSNLTISSTHSPKRSAPRPTPSTTRQTSDAGTQCDTRSATSSLSSTSTASNENTDTKKSQDDGERDDDPPPSNGSQAFQIC